MNCGELKIDIGCGKNKEEGYIGIDTIKIDDVNIVRDIDKYGLPFCDNSAINIKAYSVFEHFDNFLFVMQECWRVLKSDGVLKGYVPNAGSDESFRDPTHRRFFTINTFKYFDKENAKKYELYGIKSWKIINIKGGDSMTKSHSGIYFEMSPYK